VRGGKHSNKLLDEYPLVFMSLYLPVCVDVNTPIVLGGKQLTSALFIIQIHWRGGIFHDAGYHFYFFQLLFVD
jgi:hypothetical protein